MLKEANIMEEYQFRKAALSDLDMLVPLRLEVLRTVNGLSPSEPLPEIERATRAYFEAQLGGETHTTMLALLDGAPIGCGSACYFSVMPTYCNPDGRKAYLMNLYVRPAYRRKGIARRLLHALIADSRAHGIDFITLEATAMGRPLYERSGFTAMPDEMCLTEHRL